MSFLGGNRIPERVLRRSGSNETPRHPQDLDRDRPVPLADEAAPRTAPPPRYRGSGQPRPASPDYAPRGTLAQLAAELARSRHDEVATISRGMTYGEMIKWGEQVTSLMPENKRCTAEEMAAILWRWSHADWVNTPTAPEAPLVPEAEATEETQTTF